MNKTNQLSSFSDTPPVPHAHGKSFDPLDPEQVAHPWPWLTAARKEAPVFFLPKLGVWCVSRYEDVYKIYHDPVTFSNKGNIPLRPFSPILQDAYPQGHPTKRSIVRMDPPEHTRVRKLVGKVLVPGIVTRLEPKIRERCNALIDTFVKDGQFNFVNQFATRLPVQVILDFIGAPPELEQDIIFWGQDFRFLLEGGPELTPELENEIAVRGKRVVGWILEFIEERRIHDRGDLISGLIRATGDDGEPVLSNDEIISTINTFIVAGHETTAILLSQLIGELMRHPTQWEQVKSNRALIPNAVEEALRFWSPTRSLSRRVMRDTVIGGVPIPEGAQVQVLLLAANHDETVFEEPDTFDIHRKNANKHLSFGHGIHFCIGAQLGRLEARIALETIIDRIPNISLVEGQEERWIPHLLFSRLESIFLDLN